MQRTVEHDAADAAVAHHSVAQQVDAQRGKVLGHGGPILRRPARADEQAAVQREIGDRVGGVKRQSAKWVCTISKPCATQATQPRNSASDMPAVGARAKPNTTSGSSRGWLRPASDSVASAPSSSAALVSHTGPQIGAYTP